MPSNCHAPFYNGRVVETNPVEAKVKQSPFCSKRKHVPEACLARMFAEDQAPAR